MKEKKALGKTGSVAVAAVGLALGVLLMLFGSFGGLSDRDGQETGELASAEEYRIQVEERIVSLCSAVRGAGEVRVFVTVSGGYEYVYSVDERGECVTVGSGSSERAVVEAVRSPEIVGVGIVCAGAGDPAVKGTNRIVVAQGN